MEKKREINRHMPINIVDDKSRGVPFKRCSKDQQNGKHKAGQVMDGIILLGENTRKIIMVQQEYKQ